MLNGYRLDAGRLAPVADSADAVWIDLLRPTREEERTVEQAVAIAVPTREEMQEIEESSRLYQEDGSLFMTANILAHGADGAVEAEPVTFILSADRLVTLRYHEPRFFNAFIHRAQKAHVAGSGPETLLVALLEASVDRLADILEKAAREVDRISHEVFADADGRKLRGNDYRVRLVELGREGDLVSMAVDSIVSLERLVGFLALATGERRLDKDLRARVKAISRDARSIADHAQSVTQKITFLLDATLGLINIEQNGIIKIFSVAAVVFLPPTLIASIYGMNFEHMPELAQQWGYPVALGAMVLSAILPYLFFKRKGWL